MICKLNDLQLGDTVKLFDGAFGYGTVTKIRNGMVEVMRPYGATSDFSMNGEVIHFVGMEIMKFHDWENVQYDVVQRKTLK